MDVLFAVIKVSDPAVGGTYMTLLNTVCNLGGNWPSTLALWSVDSLTWKSCQGAVDLQDNLCRNAAEAQVGSFRNRKLFWPLSLSESTIYIRTIVLLN